MSVAICALLPAADFGPSTPGLPLTGRALDAGGRIAAAIRAMSFQPRCGVIAASRGPAHGLLDRSQADLITAPDSLPDPPELLRRPVHPVDRLSVRCLPDPLDDEQTHRVVHPCTSL